MINYNPNFLAEQALKIKEYLDEHGDDANLGDIESFVSELGVDVNSLEKEMQDYKSKLNLRFVKTSSDAVIPKYNYDGDSGFDLYSTEDVIIEKFGRSLIPTGLKFQIPDGYEIQVRTKSGLAINQGLMVLNSPGTVDSGYIGEVKVIVFNTNNYEFKIPKGMKVAQAVLCPVVNGAWVNLEQINNLDTSERDDKGFGSTGLF